MSSGKAATTVAGVLLVLAAAGCNDFDLGPTLDVQIQEGSLALQPTEETVDDCCCRVIGIATNVSTVAVHATVRFDAFHSGESEPFASAVDFMENLQPGEQRAIAASGILSPCAEVDRYALADLDLRGVWFPH